MAASIAGDALRSNSRAAGQQSSIRHTFSAPRIFASADKEAMKKEFWRFFNTQPGAWFSERTYHYFSPELPKTGEIERSQTDFTVAELDDYVKRKVLEVCGEEVTQEGLDAAAGYKVFFDTIMEKRGRVTNSTNVLFVPCEFDGTLITGKYFRDIAYEEAKPFIGKFSFDCKNDELLMITRYSRITSVDSIILLRDDLRVRKIMNYANPADENARPTELVLGGFGLEHRK